jgi:hypothetical protein
MSYEAVFQCGFCKRKIPLSDESFLKLMNDIRDMVNLCECGHISYCSSMRAKFLVDTKGWRGGYGRTK